MNKKLLRIMLLCWGACLTLLCCLASPTAVFASGKQYPVEGTVTTLGTHQEIGGGMTSNHRTYTVKTPTRVFVLECRYAMDGIHIHSPSECGGKKKIEIGDTVSFRVNKNYAYLRTADGKEQKLAVLSEGTTEDSAQPAKP